MKRITNEAGHAMAQRALAVLLAAALGVSGLLAGCATSTPIATPADTVAVIEDDAAPMSDRTAAQEAALAEEERATDVDELGYLPGQIVVVYEDDATEAEREEAVESLGAEETGEVAEFDSGDVSALTIDDGMTVETAVRQAEAEDAVKYAVPNYVVELFDDPAAEALGAIGVDSRSADQWYLNFIEAPAAWDLLAAKAPKAKPVKVAVLDTGASLSHPDLTNIINKQVSAEVVWTDNTNAASWKTAPLRGDGYTNGGSTVDELSSHGTHVSGIIAGEAGNGGILGVASGGTTAQANKLVDLVVIDAFSLLVDSGGTKKANASLQDLVFALEYARDAGCKIVNMSLGVQTDDAQVAGLFEALCADLATNHGMLIVSAAGNSNTSATCYPAACKSALGVISVSECASVGASSVTFTRPAWGDGSETVLRSSFSNYGDWCDLSAPGEKILSTYQFNGKTDGYQSMSGTSMACPVVTGVAALVMAANPQLSPAQVRQVLCDTATDLHTKGKDAQTGYGVVNARAAVAAAVGAASTVQATPTAVELKDANVTVSSAVYTGSSQEPSVTVKVNGTTLKQGTDYTVSVSGTPKNAGSYSVSIQGGGSYSGTVKKTFTIAPANIGSARIEVAAQTYSGKALTPAPAVSLNGAKLVKNVDYTVAYSNNTQVGTAQVTIKGTGNYTGSKTASFAIAESAAGGGSAPTTGSDGAPESLPVVKDPSSPGPASGVDTTAPVNKATTPADPEQPVAVAKKNIAAASVSGISASYAFTGSAISPKPVLRFGSTVLKAGVDYTVGYRNNRAVGTAVVTMTGIGAYKGTLQMRFTIKAPTVKAVKISKLKAAKSAFTVSWKKASGKVTSYPVQYSTSKKFTKSATATATVKASSKSTLSKTVKKLKAKKTYYVRVRTVYKVGGESFVSSWSAVKKVTTKR